MNTYFICYKDNGDVYVHSYGDLLERLEASENDILMSTLEDSNYVRGVNDGTARFAYKCITDSSRCFNEGGSIAGIIDSPLGYNDFAEYVRSAEQEIIKKQWTPIAVSSKSPSQKSMGPILFPNFEAHRVRHVFELTEHVVNTLLSGYK